MGRKTTKGATLSLKEQRFIDNFLGGFNGNATRAALDAGYGKTYASAAVMASRLFKKAKVQQAIVARTRHRQRQSIMDADERDEVLSAIARAERKTLARINAIKELNKCTGRHSMTHLHKGKITLEQALEASRR